MYSVPNTLGIMFRGVQIPTLPFWLCEIALATSAFLASVSTSVKWGDNNYLVEVIVKLDTMAYVWSYIDSLLYSKD